LTTGADDDLIRFMLDGKKPRYRRPDTPRRKQWIELDSEDGLESAYQHLLWVLGERMATIEEARLAEFDWSTLFGIGYHDLAGWISQGATLRDRGLLRALAKAGVTSRHTALWWTSNARTSMTIMQALLATSVTVEDVATLVRSGSLTG
jgi:hypothetical protein